jgi:hypothetical protein
VRGQDPAEDAADALRPKVSAASATVGGTVADPVEAVETANATTILT